MDSEALRVRLRRPAVRMEVGGFRPPDAPTSSWFGRVMMALPGETWPTAGGEPMHALFQLNLAELPYRPSLLEDLAFLTVFIGPRGLPSGETNGNGWCLRAYRAGAGLVALEQRETGSPIRAFPMRPSFLEEDFPRSDDVPSDLVDAFEKARAEVPDAFTNSSGFKVGGWPTLIQSEIFWAPLNRHPARPEFVFQVDSEAKANWAWGDGGVGYFGRGTVEGFEDTWTLEWQCL